eukprot:77348-Chlamydomonas_euryale.AAC.4
MQVPGHHDAWLRVHVRPFRTWQGKEGVAGLVPGHPSADEIDAWLCIHAWPRRMWPAGAGWAPAHHSADGIDARMSLMTAAPMPHSEATGTWHRPAASQMAGSARTSSTKGRLVFLQLYTSDRHLPQKIKREAADEETPERQRWQPRERHTGGSIDRLHGGWTEMSPRTRSCRRPRPAQPTAPAAAAAAAHVLAAAAVAAAESTIAAGAAVRPLARCHEGGSGREPRRRLAGARKGM